MEIAQIDNDKLAPASEQAFTFHETRKQQIAYIFVCVFQDIYMFILYVYVCFCSRRNESEAISRLH
jgi:hypothetical protein